ncbi:MAG TPA: sigma-E factor negative regulatory protein [Wenzhouxiangellaceae bacterium]|nr:sigma-E factor negative regulatory protein [Wenzhouxiangellaceae bacterium]
MTNQTEPRETAPVDRNNEPISALVDGELDQKGADFLIRRLSDDPHMHHQWQRFHLVRACLQREFSGPVSLVGRVQAALQEEAAPERAGRFTSLMRMGVGGAIAASVAMVAVLGLANRIDSENSGVPEPVQTPGFVSQSTALDRQFNAPLVPAGLGTNENSAGATRTTSATQQRINRYMIRHSQAVGGNGFISYTPVLAEPANVQTLADEPADEAGRTTEGR